jgi:hypothetical protein
VLPGRPCEALPCVDDSSAAHGMTSICEPPHYQLGNWIVMLPLPQHLQLRGYLPCP